MKFKVKDMDIETGGPLIVAINYKDAKLLDLHKGDRIQISTKLRKTIAIVDIAETSKSISQGEVGLFEEVIKKLKAKDKTKVYLSLVDKPDSIAYIKKKLDGDKLNYQEIREIIKDISEDRLSDIELSFFIAAAYTKIMDNEETVNLTKAMINTGDILKFDQSVIIDKHCIGGVAGNRTTMIAVPIVVAAGLTMPKTSSRSITSPAGTADTMEVLCPVTFIKSKIKKIVRKTGGCMVWGGAMNLAPADDKIIRVEHPLNIDAKSQLLASILAKKASVSSNHVLIDIPTGIGSKMPDLKKAKELKEDFEYIGKKLGMKIKVIMTDGTEPIGFGLGPVLEARDVLHVLRNDPEKPRDLMKKGVHVAGLLLEMGGKVRKGKGEQMALDLLLSGKAYDKFIEIIKAQGGKEISPYELPLSKYKEDIRAKKAGKVVRIDNKFMAKTAKIAGAPDDKGAGVFLHKKTGSIVKKGDILFTIYSENKFKLNFAKKIYKETKGIHIHKI